MDLEAFRTLLRERLSVRGAQARLSEQSGIPSPVIGRWRDGIGRPTDTNLKKLAPALGVPYEDLAKMCDYLPGEPSAAGAGVRAAHSELHARLSRLERTLGHYPRAVWWAVMEANDKMVEALAHQLPTNALDPTDNNQSGGLLAGDQNRPNGPVISGYGLVGAVA